MARFIRGLAKLIQKIADSPFDVSSIIKTLKNKRNITLLNQLLKFATEQNRIDIIKWILSLPYIDNNVVIVDSTDNTKTLISCTITQEMIDIAAERAAYDSASFFLLFNDERLFIEYDNDRVSRYSRDVFRPTTQIIRALLINNKEEKAFNLILDNFNKKKYNKLEECNFYEIFKCAVDYRRIAFLQQFCIKTINNPFSYYDIIDSDISKALVMYSIEKYDYYCYYYSSDSDAHREYNQILEILIMNLMPLGDIASIVRHTVAESNIIALNIIARVMSKNSITLSARTIDTSLEINKPYHATTLSIDTWIFCNSTHLSVLNQKDFIYEFYTPKNISAERLNNFLNYYTGLIDIADFAFNGTAANDPRYHVLLKHSNRDTIKRWLDTTCNTVSQAYAFEYYGINWHPADTSLIVVPNLTINEFRVEVKHQFKEMCVNTLFTLASLDLSAIETYTIMCEIDVCARLLPMIDVWQIIVFIKNERNKRLDLKS